MWLRQRTTARRSSTPRPTPPQVEIGGHTDNVGTHDYNLKLSDARAAAVKDWLTAHGIAAGRLTSHGYGDTQPIVPNDSELNRAKNRRVELKKPNCK
ncbi:MAG: OmpA family protein [Deltaproteobacteria bacterium]|nr:OmpA family protein [Deltaproteobacteria bacterium]